MKPNPGRQPEETRGKRVWVRLANGSEPRVQVSATSPPGWAADTTNWSKRPCYPFNVTHYEVI